MSLFRKYNVGAIAITHGTTGPTSQTLKDLPLTIDGRPAYLYGFVFEIRHTPTFTTQPTRTALNMVVTDLTIDTGYSKIVSGLNFNDVRAMEIIQSGGKLMVPDLDTGTTDAAASTVARWYTRCLWIADPRFADDDFAIPVALLASKNATIRLTPGGTADVGSDTTAATSTVQITALLLPRNEIVIPAQQEWIRRDFSTSPFREGGEALYADMSLFNSSSYDAITAGDFGDIIVETGRETLIQSVTQAVLTRAAWMEGGVGQLTEAKGDPRSATDDDAKTLQGGTGGATQMALAATPFVHAQVFAAYRSRGGGSHITQLPYVPSELRVTFSSLQSGTSRTLMHRVLKTPAPQVADMTVNVMRQLGIPAFHHFAPKSKSGKRYVGPYAEFLPTKVHLPDGRGPAAG